MPVHALRRRGGLKPATTTLFFAASDEAALAAEARSEELFALDEALESQIVELRYFGGLTVEEAAEFLKLSPRTVEREWTMAKAWLYSTLTEVET